MDDELREEEEDREEDFPGTKKGKGAKSDSDDFDDGIHEDIEGELGEEELGEEESLDKLIEEEEEGFDYMEDEEKDSW